MCAVAGCPTCNLQHLPEGFNPRCSHPVLDKSDSKYQCPVNYASVNKAETDWAQFRMREGLVRDYVDASTNTCRPPEMVPLVSDLEITQGLLAAEGDSAIYRQALALYS